jgi:hypothetical protein
VARNRHGRVPRRCGVRLRSRPARSAGACLSPADATPGVRRPTGRPCSRCRWGVGSPICAPCGSRPGMCGIARDGQRSRTGPTSSRSPRSSRPATVSRSPTSPRRPASRSRACAADRCGDWLRPGALPLCSAEYERSELFLAEQGFCGLRRRSVPQNRHGDRPGPAWSWDGSWLSTCAPH